MHTPGNPVNQPDAASRADKTASTCSKKRNIRRVAIYVTAACVIALCGSWLLAKPLLMVRHTPSKADAIVLPGGNNERRGARSAQLYEEGMAPVVVGVGIGHAETFSKLLMEMNVPPSAVVAETNSRNTAENAEATIQILRELGAKRAIIVTNWWHARRCYSCFVSHAPEITFLSVPVDEGLDELLPRWSETPMVFKEYMKITAYCLLHGIVPRGDRGPGDK